VNKASVLGNNAAAKKLKKDLAIMYAGSFTGKMNDGVIPTRSPANILNTIDSPVSSSIIIRGRPNKGSEIIISSLTYTAMSSQHIVVFLAATTQDNYDNLYGSGNDNLPFRRRGLMSLLIHLTKAIVFSQYANPAITVCVAVSQNDPSRQLFFKKLGFVFQTATAKTIAQFFRSSSGMAVEKLPVNGNEYFYQYRFGTTKCIHWLYCTALDCFS
jgi:hypothetical protein